MRIRTHDLLRKVAAEFPCIVVSGRSRADLQGKLHGIEVRNAVGNHGAETGPISARVLARVRRWRRTLEPHVEVLEGVWVEDKGASLAIHYRAYPVPQEAELRIRQIAGAIAGVRLVGGKMVVNVVPEEAPHKGNALIAEKTRLKCESVLYVGDDDTDEDAFAAHGPLVGVRVGRKENSRARYYLRDQNEIDELLQRLLSLRSLA